jgi:hypothetical protein
VNTTSNRAVTRKEIQGGMEAVILGNAKAKVEITMMGENTWSICGNPDDACKAIKFLEKTRLVKEFGERSTLEDELFIYFRTGA